MKIMSPMDFDNPNDISMYYTGCYLGYTDKGEQKPCYVRNFYDRHSDLGEEEFGSNRDHWEFMIRFLDERGEVQEKFIKQEALVPYPPYTTYLEGTNCWLNYEPTTSYKKGLLRHGLFYTVHSGLFPENNTRGILKSLTYEKPNPIRVIKDQLIYKGHLVKNERMMKCLNLLKTTSVLRSNSNEVNKAPLGQESEDGTGQTMGRSETGRSMSYQEQLRELDSLTLSMLQAERSLRSRNSRSRPAAPPTSTATFGTWTTDPLISS